MKEELTLKKCKSRLFWGIFLHSLWLSLVLGFAGGFIIAIPIAMLGEGIGDIIETILNLVISATAVFIAVKITNNGILKKYKVNKEILQKVATKVIVIFVIIEVICLGIAMLFVTLWEDILLIAAEQNVEHFEQVGGIEAVKEEVENQITKTYITTLLTGTTNLIIQILAVKYAVYDLEKRAIVEED